eukprot:Lankesteria_metandrocarpae@DN5326_c0_g1_i2.p1
MQFLGVTIRSVLIIVALKNVCECNKIVETPLQTGVRYPELQNDSFEMYQDGMKRTIYIRTNGHYYHLEVLPSQRQTDYTVEVCWEVDVEERTNCRDSFAPHYTLDHTPRRSTGDIQIDYADPIDFLVIAAKKALKTEHISDPLAHPRRSVNYPNLGERGHKLKFIVDFNDQDIIPGQYHLELLLNEDGSCMVEKCAEVIKGFFGEDEKDCRELFRSTSYIFKRKQYRTIQIDNLPKANLLVIAVNGMPNAPPCGAISQGLPKVKSHVGWFRSLRCKSKKQ